MGRDNRREREQFLKGIESIVNESPDLKKKLQDLWLIPPDENTPDDIILQINQKALIACREDLIHTNHYV